MTIKQRCSGLPAVDAKAVVGTDGRAYNAIVHDSDSAGTVIFADGNARRLPLAAMWHQNMAKLDSSPLSNGKAFAPSDYVCTDINANRNIGCLVANSRCTLGLSGREAAFNTQTDHHIRNEPAKVMNVPPSTAAIAAATYPPSHAMYLNASRGFENIMLVCVDRGGSRAYCEDQVTLANAIYNVSDTPGNAVGDSCQEGGFVAFREAVCIGARGSTTTLNTLGCGSPTTQTKTDCRPDTRAFTELSNRQNP